MARKALSESQALQSANSVTKDFLKLENLQPGILLACQATRRRIYVHSLNDLPLHHPYVTRHGNTIVRDQDQQITLANSISIHFQAANDSPSLTMQIASEIPTESFIGPTAVRDEKALQLLQRGKSANAQGDFDTACACFEAAYALSIRAGMLVSAANMRLKMGQPVTASAMYNYVLTECSLLPAEAEMARRKLQEIRDTIPANAADSISDSPAHGIVAARFDAEFDGGDFGDLDDFAEFNDNAFFSPGRSSLESANAMLSAYDISTTTNEDSLATCTATNPSAAEMDAVEADPRAQIGESNMPINSSIDKRLEHIEAAIANLPNPGVLTGRSGIIKDGDVSLDRKMDGDSRGMEGVHQRLLAVEDAVAKMSAEMTHIRSQLRNLASKAGEGRDVTGVFGGEGIFTD